MSKYYIKIKGSVGVDVKFDKKLSLQPGGIVAADIKTKVKITADLQSPSAAFALQAVGKIIDDSGIDVESVVVREWEFQ